MTSANTLGPGTQVRGRGTYTLGAEIGRGGQGAVFMLHGHPQLVAKIYLQQLGEGQIAKLQLLVTKSQPSLTEISAWPQELLTWPGSRHVIGFVMPAIQRAKPLHTFITPSDRMRIAPNATFKTLMAIGSNIARAVTTFHQTGCVIGDMNWANILILPDGRVRIIDIDSIQIGSKPHLRCPVGMEELTAPELQGGRLARVTRKRGSDDFALAVLIFQLLCVGRHPHSGNGDMPLGKAITKRRHALRRFNRSSPLHKVGLPPRSFLAPELVVLFRRAFAPWPWQTRPSAMEWTNALEDGAAILVTCKRNTAHLYPPSVRRCPWCGLEKRRRPSFFTPTRQTPSASAGRRLLGGLLGSR